jgi:hypothetical protein
MLLIVCARASLCSANRTMRNKMQPPARECHHMGLVEPSRRLIAHEQTAWPSASPIAKPSIRPSREIEILEHSSTLQTPPSHTGAPVCGKNRYSVCRSVVLTVVEVNVCFAASRKKTVRQVGHSFVVILFDASIDTAALHKPCRYGVIPGMESTRPALLNPSPLPTIADGFDATRKTFRVVPLTVLSSRNKVRAQRLNSVSWSAPGAQHGSTARAKRLRGVGTRSGAEPGLC